MDSHFLAVPLLPQRAMPSFDPLALNFGGRSSKAVSAAEEGGRKGDLSPLQGTKLGLGISALGGQERE